MIEVEFETVRGKRRTIMAVNGAAERPMTGSVREEGDVRELLQRQVDEIVCRLSPPAPE